MRLEDKILTPLVSQDDEGGETTEEKEEGEKEGEEKEGEEKEGEEKEKEEEA